MKKILILCGEKPHQDPRTRWHTEFLKKHGYNIDIISYAQHAPTEESLPIYQLASVQKFSQSNFVLFAIYIKKFLIADIQKIKPSFLILLTTLLPILIIYRPISIIKRKYLAKRNTLDYLYKILFLIKQHIILSAKLSLYQKTKHPNIIICQEPHTLSAGVLRYKTKKTIIIFDAHEISYDEEIGQDHLTKKIIKQYEEYFLQHVDYFITVSDDIKNLYINNNPHLKNISHTIPNVNSKTHIIQNNNQTKKTKFLISSSYFSNKGLEEFISAWKTINPKNATLSLMIFNPDRFNKNFQNTLEKLKGGYENITLIPTIPQNKIISYYANYDIGIIFYNPSLNLNYRYCCPNKFGEYLFAGLAILSTNSTYLTRQISNSQCGITYDPSNKNNTIKAIKYLIENPKQVTIFKKNSTKLAKEKFHYEKFGEPLLQFIQNHHPPES